MPQEQKFGIEEKVRIVRQYLEREMGISEASREAGVDRAAVRHRMEFHVIELPKLPPEWREDSDNILLWAKFINAERREEFEMLAKQNPYIDSAYQHLQEISQDGQKRLEYEARQKAIHDYNQGMLEAEERGEQRGRAAGKAEGRTEGIELVAKNLIARGFSTDVITDLTGLTARQIESLK